MKTLKKRFNKYNFNTLEEDAGGTSNLNDNFFDDLNAEAPKDSVGTPELNLEEVKALGLFKNIEEALLNKVLPFFSKKFFKKGTLLLEQYEHNKEIILFDRKVNIEEKTAQSTTERLDWIFGDETYSAKEPPSKDTFLMEDHIGYVISFENFIQTLRLLPEAGQNLLHFTAKRLREERREAVYMADELSRKDRLLLNINQPWLEITFKGDVTTFHSQKAIRCLGFENLTTIEGKNFFNLLYKDASRSVRIAEKKKNQAILKDLFFSGSEIMADLLPKNITVENKHYHITYDPVSEKKDSGEKRVTAVLVILKDVTVEKQLEKIQDEDKNAEKTRVTRNADPIGYINMVSQVKVISQMIEQYNFDIIENHGHLNEEDRKRMMRDLHTAKGMSGFFIESLKDIIHKLEDYFRADNVNEYNVKSFLTLRQTFSQQFKKANQFMEELGDTLLNLIRGYSYSYEEQKELMAGLSLLQKSNPAAASLHQIVSQKLKAPAEEILKGWQEDIDRMTTDERYEDNHGKAIDVVPVIKENLFIHKRLITDLSGVLKHLYRNCVAHGIEPPEERIKQGKPEIGKITVKIWDQKKTLFISIHDDGQGIELEKVKTTALQKGVVTEEELKQLDQQSLINLIFKPGFSTMKKVTDVAGRGVGMDAVFDLIVKKFHGTISFGSKYKEGSRILLQIPLTQFENMF